MEPFQTENEVYPPAERIPAEEGGAAANINIKEDEGGEDSEEDFVESTDKPGDDLISFEEHVGPPAAPKIKREAIYANMFKTKKGLEASSAPH